MRLSDEDTRLLFTVHHLVCDGWSYDIVIREISECYSARVEGRDAALGTVSQMQEYVSWEQTIAGQEEGRRHRDYWLQMYRTSPPPLDLPFARPRPPQRSYRGSRIATDLPAAMCARLDPFCREHGTTLFAFLLAAFELLLYRVSRQSDLVVGVFSAGQNTSGLSGLVGHCANTLPVRIAVDGDAPFVEFLARSRDAVWDAHEHAHYTFGSLIQDVSLPRDPSRVAVCMIAVWNSVF